jgi:hypothetical protein
LLRTLTVTGTGNIVDAPAYYHTIVTDDLNGHMFISDGSGTTMFDATTGVQLARTVGVSGTLIVDASLNRVFVTSLYDGTPGVQPSSTLWLLNATSGALEGSLVVSPTSWLSLVAIDEATNRLYVSSTMTLDDGMSAYVILVLDSRTGALINVIPDGATRVLPEVSRGRTLILSGEYVHIVDAATAQTLYTTEVPCWYFDAPWTRPLIVDNGAGRLFVNCPAPTDKEMMPIGPSTLAIMDTTTGATLATSLDQTVLAVDEGNGRVVALDGNKPVLFDFKDMWFLGTLDEP